MIRGSSHAAMLQLDCFSSEQTGISMDFELL